jgi:hypothetical protein
MRGALGRSRSRQDLVEREYPEPEARVLCGEPEANFRFHHTEVGVVETGEEALRRIPSCYGNGLLVG